MLDSSFADLHQLADEMVDKVRRLVMSQFLYGCDGSVTCLSGFDVGLQGREHGLNVPKFVTRVAIRMIRSSVQARAGEGGPAIALLAEALLCVT